MTTPRFPWHSAGADIEGEHRYRLWREWQPGHPRALFVMLNPSTADAEQDDPTIRRCIGFATDWMFGGIEVVNLFAYRCTNPSDLGEALDPVGPRNDAVIEAAAAASTFVVAAWGAPWNAPTRARAKHVEQLLLKHGHVNALGLTKDGHPRHPLYTRRAIETVVWRERSTS